MSKDERTAREAAASNDARASEPRPLGGMVLQRSNSLPRSGVRVREAGGVSRSRSQSRGDSRGDFAEMRRDSAEIMSSDLLSSSQDMGIVSHRDICGDYAEVLATPNPNPDSNPDPVPDPNPNPNP